LTLAGRVDTGRPRRHWQAALTLADRADTGRRADKDGSRR
jgi:hypothetical protein